MESVIKTHTGYGNVARTKDVNRRTTNAFTNWIVKLVNKLADAPSMTDETIFESRDWPYLWKRNIPH